MSTFYRRADWTYSRVAAIVIGLTLFAHFAVLHAIRYVQNFARDARNKHIRRRQIGIALRGEILRTNWTVLVGLGGPFLAHCLIDLSQNESTCRMFVGIIVVMYLLTNFQCYRVLLLRSKAYDVMKEYQKLYKIINITVHVFCTVVILLYLLINIGIAEYQIEDKGDYRVCTQIRSGPLSKFPITPVILTLGDTAISISLLYLIILPVFKPGFKLSSDVGVTRNMIFSSIAIFSTFSLLIILTAVDIAETTYPGLVIDLGMWDVIINIICINLCWPLKYYSSMYGCTDEAASTRSGGATSDNKKQAMSDRVRKYEKSGSSGPRGRVPSLTKKYFREASGLRLQNTMSVTPLDMSRLGHRYSSTTTNRKLVESLSPNSDLPMGRMWARESSVQDRKDVDGMSRTSTMTPSAGNRKSGTDRQISDGFNDRPSISKEVVMVV